jgi:hypothetical protein
MYKYPETHKAGMETVRSWLKWTYNEIMTEEFFESIVNLEEAMQKEKLIETKVHEVLEAVMLVQEITEDPIVQIQMISEDMEETYEMKCEEFKELENYVEKKHEEIEELYKRSNVTLEEIKEISEVLNYGEQIIIEKEEQLGKNQIVPMNIRNSVKKKKKKKSEKQHLARERKNYMMQLD